MKYIIPALVVSICIFSTGCKDSTAEKKVEDKVLPAASNPGDTSKPINANQSTEAAITPNTPVTTTAVVSSNNLNPEHGKPGHRCDIAVGAPLTSQPAATTAISPSTSTKSTIPAPALTTSTKPSATTTTGAGLNPEHGKPGHRCDIGVGEPLNSQPKQAAVTTQPATTVSPVTQKPAPLAPAIPATTVAPGMNPEHGKPGHRCDIAVGAPLNSKPNQ